METQLTMLKHLKVARPSILRPLQAFVKKPGEESPSFSVTFPKLVGPSMKQLGRRSAKKSTVLPPKVYEINYATCLSALQLAGENDAKLTSLHVELIRLLPTWRVFLLLRSPPDWEVAGIVNRNTNTAF